MEETKQNRIYFTVTKDQYNDLKTRAGMISLSVFIRSKVFEVDTQQFKNSDIREWVELLNQVPNRDELYSGLVQDAKNIDLTPVDLFIKRIK